MTFELLEKMVGPPGITAKEVRKKGGKRTLSIGGNGFLKEKRVKPQEIVWVVQTKVNLLDASEVIENRWTEGNSE